MQYDHLPNIGVDLDGVIYDFTASVKYYLRHYQGFTNDMLTHNGDWHFYREWGMTDEQFVAMCDAGVDAGIIFRIGAPFGDAVWLNELVRFGKVHFVTDRKFGTKSRLNTLAWLREHRLPYDSITFSSDKTIVPADYFIDDRDKNFWALYEAGVNVYLRDRPWNQHVDAGERRIYGLRDFLNVVMVGEGELNDQ